MNLEHREQAFEEIMNGFIILLRPSPYMLNNPSDYITSKLFKTDGLIVLRN